MHERNKVKIIKIKILKRKIENVREHDTQIQLKQEEDSVHLTFKAPDCSNFSIGLMESLEGLTKSLKTGSPGKDNCA